MLFYSKYKDVDLHAIAEFILIIKEKSAPQVAAAAAGQEENKEEVKGAAQAKPKV